VTSDFGDEGSFAQGIRGPEGGDGIHAVGEGGHPDECYHVLLRNALAASLELGRSRSKNGRGGEVNAGEILGKHLSETNCQSIACQYESSHWERSTATGRRFC
jgi:hypothetical protein